MKSVFMNKKDQLIKDYINKHYKELVEEIDTINDKFDEFINNKAVQKAVSFDLFQIGELFNKLSDETKRKLNNRDIRGIIDVRNFIAHGYIYIKKTEIWNTVHNDLPRLIEQIEEVKF